MSPADHHAEERSAVDAARGAAEKRGYVRAMFASIAPRYDLLNHLLSFNIDRGWRRRAIAALEWARSPSGSYLDLCAGTLDVAVELARQPGFSGRVVGVDFVEAMLQAGRAKSVGRPAYGVAADALALPLANASCDGAIVAFGVRNLADLDAGLREVARVVRPGGRFVILEFSTPPSALVRAVYGFYSNRLLPLVGGLISGNRGAYRYLPESISRFPSPAKLADQLRAAGFTNVRWDLLTLGTVAVHVGTRG
jgi:demethylmenaquinone methyltransferase/2-methoxy-6-polyprenyl-1,4-benzoquinol methylase